MNRSTVYLLLSFLFAILSISDNQSPDPWLAAGIVIAALRETK